ncbi:MAG: Crp/Fnr family transcriptional regulator [Candidatus Eisenbacteria bacterium]|uniref:Crp/Fnr family transcriptional regulator n=1 Tax=Eiseniibacteriota bacterium TaxID=2212470 RepID=A0A938BQ10_UNCEI|nr:Crp/Fnr family transcriptional regulator [Candidatus Eisenbacteria bacterium]
MSDGLSSACDPSARSWAEGLSRRYPILDRLSPVLVREFCRRARTVDIPAGAVAFDEDSPCTSLTFPFRGAIRVGRLAHTSREILLYRVRPGEICILTVSCLLGRTTYSARGLVEKDLAGIAIPADLFERLVAECGAFRAYIFELLGSRVTALMQLVEEVAFHRLDQRLAAILLRRFVETGATQLAVTHQDLADQVGSARETVSRVLESLENDGGITLARGRVALRSAAALRDVAGALASRERKMP